MTTDAERLDALQRLVDRKTRWKNANHEETVWPLSSDLRVRRCEVSRSFSLYIRKMGSYSEIQFYGDTIRDVLDQLIDFQKTEKQ